MRKYIVDYGRWPVRRGQTLERSQLHLLVGGSHQWGITSCRNGTAMLVFANPGRAHKYGYDKWEGQRRSGVYDYTGQGLAGDQTVDRGSNRKLLLSQVDFIPIHLFEAAGTTVTYKGRYRLAEAPFRVENAPDINMDIRKVIVFSLVADDGN